MKQQTLVFDANLKKKLLSECKRDSRIQSHEYSKFLANKKALITIIFGKCNKAIKTKLLLERVLQRTAKQEDSLISLTKHAIFVLVAKMLPIIHALQASCSIEVVAQLQSNKLHDPHDFKEEVKIKYNAIKAIYRKFPDVAVMMTLLAAAAPPIDCMDWILCAIS